MYKGWILYLIVLLTVLGVDIYLYAHIFTEPIHPIEIVNKDFTPPILIPEKTAPTPKPTPAFGIPTAMPKAPVCMYLMNQKVCQ